MVGFEHSVNLEHVLGRPRELLVPGPRVVLAALRVLVEVVPGAEGATGATQDHDANVVVLARRANGGGHRLDQLRRSAR